MKKKLDKNAKIKIEIVNDLPKKGVWLPVSVVAHITKYSSMTINRLIHNKILNAIKFPKCITLVNLQDITKWVRGGGKKK